MTATLPVSQTSPDRATLAPMSLAPGTHLPVARYRFAFRMQQDLRLPRYAGSLLRGQFGRALRRASCVTGARTCEGCPVLSACPYPQIFETPAPAEHRLQKFSQVPNPYVIEPPPFGTRCVPAGERLVFGVVLVGQAIERLALIVHAFQRALGQGLGRVRARGLLEDLAHETQGGWRSIWDAAGGRIAAHDAELAIPAFPAARSATLRIETPLRLQSQGRPLAIATLGVRTLVTNLMRRATLLMELHGGKPPLFEEPDARALAQHAQTIRDERKLRWQDWSRYSSRQKQEMTLGGAIGEWTLEGELGPLLPLLWLGQWLHAGKNATMGMGRYSLEIH